jgi:hypothetical protein
MKCYIQMYPVNSNMAQHRYWTSSVMAFSSHHQQQQCFPFSNVKIPPHTFSKHTYKVILVIQETSVLLII